MKFPIKLTILGLKGGWTSRFSIFSQSIRRKNAWVLTSSSPRIAQPNLFCGFFVKSCKKKKRKMKMLKFRNICPWNSVTDKSKKETIMNIHKVVYALSALQESIINNKREKMNSLLYKHPLLLCSNFSDKIRCDLW